MGNASKRLATDEGLQKIVDALNNTETIQQAKVQIQAETESQIANARSEIQSEIESQINNAKSEIQTETETQIANVQASSQEITVKVDQNTQEITTLKQDVGKKITYVTPEMFGAVGDGVVDDTVAIQNAVDSGYRIKGNPEKCYFVTTVTINKVSFFIEDCNFFSSATDVLTSVFFINRCNYLYFKNCKFKTECVKTPAQSNDYVFSDSIVSNIHFINSNFRAGIRTCIIDRCEFDSATWAINLSNAEDTETSIEDGSYKMPDYGDFIFRNCIFKNFCMGFEIRHGKNVVLDSCKFIQGVQANRLSHCTYISSSVSTEENHSHFIVKNCEFEATSTAPIHVDNANYAIVDIENCIINFKSGSAICNYGIRNETYVNSCKIKNTDSEDEYGYLITSTHGENSGKHRFENCDILVKRLSAVSNVKEILNTEFVGCNIAFTKTGFSGSNITVVASRLIASDTFTGRLATILNSRIENCYVESYADDSINNNTLLYLMGDTDISHCLFETFSETPIGLCMGEGEYNFISHCMFKGFSEDSVIDSVFVEVTDSKYIDQYGLYTVTITDNRKCSVTATLNGEEIKSGDVVRVKKYVEFESNPDAKGYTFSHWNTGNTENPITYRIKKDTDIEAYSKQEYYGYISDNDMVVWNNDETDTKVLAVLNGTGTYRLYGRNVAADVSTSADKKELVNLTYGTELNTNDISGSIVILQYKYEEKENITSNNGCFFIRFPKVPYGGLCISFLISDITNNPKGTDTFYASAIAKKGNRVYKYSAPNEKGKIEFVFANDEISTPYVEIGLIGKSCIISEVQVEFSDVVHDYESVYIGGTVSVLEEFESVEFEQQNGYNQIIQISGESSLIEVFNPLPSKKGISIVAWDNDSINDDAKVTISENGQYKITGKNIIMWVAANGSKQLTNTNGTTVNTTDATKNVIVTQSKYDPNQGFYDANGYITFKLGCLPRRGYITLSFDYVVTQDSLSQNVSNKFSSYGKTINGIVSDTKIIITIPVSGIRPDDKAFSYNLGGVSMEISNIQAEYGEESTVYEGPFIGDIITVVDAPELVTFAQKIGGNAIVQIIGENDATICLY